MGASRRRPPSSAPVETRAAGSRGPPARRAARASRAALAHERRRRSRRLLRQLRARETLAASVPSAHVGAGVQAVAPFADNGAARRVAPARAARPGRGGGGDSARALRERREPLGVVAEEAGFESMKVHGAVEAVHVRARAAAAEREHVLVGVRRAAHEASGGGHRQSGAGRVFVFSPCPVSKARTRHFNAALRSPRAARRRLSGARPRAAATRRAARRGARDAGARGRGRGFRRFVRRRARAAGAFFGHPRRSGRAARARVTAPAAGRGGARHGVARPSGCLGPVGNRKGSRRCRPPRAGLRPQRQAARRRRPPRALPSRGAKRRSLDAPAWERQFRKLSGRPADAAPPRFSATRPRAAADIAQPWSSRSARCFRCEPRRARPSAGGRKNPGKRSGAKA